MRKIITILLLTALMTTLSITTAFCGGRGDLLMDIVWINSVQYVKYAASTRTWGKPGVSKGSVRMWAYKHYYDAPGKWSTRRTVTSGKFKFEQDYDRNGQIFVYVSAYTIFHSMDKYILYTRHAWNDGNRSADFRKKLGRYGYQLY